MRGTDIDGLAIGDHQHFMKFTVSPGLPSSFFDLIVSGCNAILLAAGLDDCVHVVSSLLSRALWRHR
jgi:hypothetical protein